jgi:hypothetical protein
MGYLDNTSITVDAILTKKGRELLAKGRNQFQITQFALADDEVDYDLWNPAHPLGSDYYGVVIESMPVTEAVPDETQSMKYKLITLPKGTTAIPVVTANVASISISTESTTPDRGFVVTPFTTQAGNTTSTFNAGANGYTFTLLDSTYVTFANGGGTSSTSESANSISVTGNSITLIGKNNNNLGDKTTKLIITGNETGGRVVIPVTITKKA